MKTKLFVTTLVAIVILLIGVAVGSVYIPIGDIINILLHNIIGRELSYHITDGRNAIVWSTRMG